MPTENRSSNTEMVSDSEMTECQFHNNCGGWCETRRELEHNLCEHCLESHDDEMAEPATAPQPRPEPATPYGWHVEWADSGDHYLFTKVEKRIEALRLDSDVKVVQLYTHADPGEIERLHRGHIQSLEALNQQTEKQRDHWMAECNALRAQLAERDALLQRMKALFRVDDPFDLYDAVCNALSASAEPSAPVERDERAEYDKWRTSTGGYVRPFNIQEWAGWMARAALERKPSALVAQLQADLTARDERIDQLEQARVPDGFALVPKSMLLSKEVIGVINFHCGDTDQEEGGQFGQYTDGRLWVGYVLDDDGNKVYGLHIATDEYPEEGSTTLVEFPEAFAGGQS